MKKISKDGVRHEEVRKCAQDFIQNLSSPSFSEQDSQRTRVDLISKTKPKVKTIFASHIDRLTER